MSAITPEMLRCTKCHRWWSNAPILVHASPYHTAIVGSNVLGVRAVANEDTTVAMCPCGGELADADILAHRATLPVSTNDPSDVAKFAKQKAAAEAAAAKKKADQEAASPPPTPTLPAP